MEVFLNSARSGRQERAISSLPTKPRKHIYWIVYNEDMIEYTRSLIEQIKGTEYMNNVTVVAKNDPSKDRATGTIYFDPTLLDLLGNGGYG